VRGLVVVMTVTAAELIRKKISEKKKEDISNIFLYVTRSSNFEIGTSLNLWLIHSIGMCRMQRFLAVLRSFFHSSLFLPPFSTNFLPSSLTSSCYLFLGLSLKLVVSKFIYNTLLGILFSSILCTCPNQHNLFNLNVSVLVGFF
jgi:hypothetical protein